MDNDRHMNGNRPRRTERASSWDSASDEEVPAVVKKKDELASPPRHHRANSWDSEEEIDIDNDIPRAETSGAPPPPATERHGGWGEDNNKGKKKKQTEIAKPVKYGRRQGRSRDDEDDTPAGQQRSKWDTDDVVTDIMTIPDLDGEEEENITRTVAEAPNVRDARVQSIRELDRDIMFQLPTSSDDGIDLTLLTTSLIPQEQVVEPDTVWEFEHIFSKLSQKYNEEEEKKEVISSMNAKADGKSKREIINPTTSSSFRSGSTSGRRAGRRGGQ